MAGPNPMLILASGRTLATGVTHAADDRIALALAELFERLARVA